MNDTEKKLTELTTVFLSLEKELMDICPNNIEKDMVGIKLLEVYTYAKESIRLGETKGYPLADII